MVTAVLHKLKQGTPWEKISHSWCTTGLIQEISHLMKQIQYMIPNHIKRKGNAVADYLANWGCKQMERSIEACPTDAVSEVELHSLQLIVNKDCQPPIEVNTWQLIGHNC